MPGTYSALATRVATAAALTALILAALLLLPRDVLAILIAVLALFGGREWARLCKMRPGLQWAYALAAGCAALAGYRIPGAQQAIFAVAAVFWLLAVPAWLGRGLSGTPVVAVAVAGLLVLVPAAVAMMVLPVAMIIAVLVFVSVSDAAAYFVGSRFGRRKLAPSISPGKSWEGAAGALVVSVALASLYVAILPQLREAVAGAAWLAYLGAAVVLFVAGVLGDLFESAAKRRAGVKDSGALLPGHGGILDRIDSATAALPLAALLWPLIGGK